MTGVSCSKAGKDSGSIDESKRVLSRATDPLTPEDDGEGGSMVTYYLPILLKDTIVVESKVVLENVAVNVHDTATNGHEAGGGLACTYNGDT